MTIHIDRHIKNPQTLAVKIQQAFLNNDDIEGYPHGYVVAQLPPHIIKILFKKQWFTYSWASIPETAPWEEIEMEDVSIGYHTFVELFTYKKLKDKLKKTPIYHILNFIVHNVPFPEEIPKKIIFNTFLHDLFDYHSIKSETILVEIIKYIDHPETKIEIKQETNFSFSLINQIINNIKNETLYYFCLSNCNLSKIPKPMENLLLKPIPYNYSNWQKERINFLLQKNYIKIFPKNKTMQRMLDSYGIPQVIIPHTKDIDFTNKNAQIIKP